MVITVLAFSLRRLKREASLILFPLAGRVFFLEGQALPLQVTVTCAPFGTRASVSVSTRVRLPNSRQWVVSVAVVTVRPRDPPVPPDPPDPPDPSAPAVPPD